MAVKWIYHCVCTYRCIHLKELTLHECHYITDDGMSKVIRHCNQLRVLDLWDLHGIKGMSALCEDPEFTLFYESMI
jgi:hypothetical protein